MQDKVFYCRFNDKHLSSSTKHLNTCNPVTLFITRQGVEADQAHRTKNALHSFFKVTTGEHDAIATTEATFT